MPHQAYRAAESVVLTFGSELRLAVWLLMMKSSGGCSEAWHNVGLSHISTTLKPNVTEP
jgi:hypothetical protein